MKELKFFRGYF